MLKSDLNRVRVTVIHCDALIRAGVATALNCHPDFLAIGGGGPASLGGDFEELLQECQVLVADYENGINALTSNSSAAVHSRPQARVVIIGSPDREFEIRKALRNRASGFLFAQCSFEELYEAVRHAANGSVYVSQQVGQRISQSLAWDPLTAREEEALHLLSEGHCNKEISRLLGVSVGTTKSHMRSIFSKLAVDTRTQALIVAERRGLLQKARLDSNHPVLQTVEVPAEPKMSFSPVTRKGPERRSAPVAA